MQNGLPTLNPFATKCRTSTENFKDCRRLSPEKRLDRLIKIISSVPAAYSKVPTASPLHISVLTGFYQRAAMLSPSAAQDHPCRRAHNSSFGPPQLFRHHPFRSFRIICTVAAHLHCVHASTPLRACNIAN